MEPRKSFPEQLKEAYARPYTLPDAENSDLIVEDDDPDLGGPVHELDVIEVEPEAETGKATTSVLKNLAERRAWLLNYRAWGVWIRVPQFGRTYYRYDFGNGDAVIVDEVETAKTSWNKEGINRRYHLLVKKGDRSECNPRGNAASEIYDYLCDKRPAVIVYQSLQAEVTA